MRLLIKAFGVVHVTMQQFSPATLTCDKKLKKDSLSLRKALL